MFGGSGYTCQCSICGHWFTSYSSQVSDRCEECRHEAIHALAPTEQPTKELIITEQYLRSHPNEIFVFGDNLLRVGKGGAAALRGEPNTYGFVTKRAPSHKDSDFYKPEEYVEVYLQEPQQLCSEIRIRNKKTYLISKLGAGLANKYQIFEKIIEPSIKPILGQYFNVKFLW